MINELMDKVIELYENSRDASVTRFKCSMPDIYDSNDISFWMFKNTLHFEFIENDLIDFKVNVADIQDIKFDHVGDTIISVIKLNNGDIVSIHNL